MHTNTNTALDVINSQPTISLTNQPNRQIHQIIKYKINHMKKQPLNKITSQPLNPTLKLVSKLHI